MSRTTDVTLEAHRQALLACRRCGHAEGIAPIVSLARSPRMMLVGQAPGRVESSGGAPFSGRAGRTLFSWFASVGLDEPVVRSRMYIAAVTRCYPGPSASGRGDRLPNPVERDHCASWLASELRLIQPRVILPVGRLAIDLFLDARPLDELIGRQHRPSRETVAMAHAPQHLMPLIIPLPHPSGASSWIHAPGHRRLLDAALRLVADHWEQLHRRARVA